VFLRELLHHLRGHVIVLLDDSSTHKGRYRVRSRPEDSMAGVLAKPERSLRR
jgi:hypothetical protein